MEGGVRVGPAGRIFGKGSGELIRVNGVEVVGVIWEIGVVVRGG